MSSLAASLAIVADAISASLSITSCGVPVLTNNPFHSSISLTPDCAANVLTPFSLPIGSAPMLARMLISPRHGSIRASVVFMTSASPDESVLQSNISNAESSANSKSINLAAA